MKKMISKFFVVSILFFVFCSTIFSKEKSLIVDFKGHSGSVTSIAFSPDGKYLVSGSEDSAIKFWQFTDYSLSLIKVLNGHQSSYGTIVFSPDGKYLICGSSDKTIKIWRISDGSLIKILKPHVWSFISSVSVSSDGRYIASGGDEIELWDFSSGNLLKNFKGYTSKGYEYSVGNVTFSPDGKYIAASSCSDREKAIRIWSMDDGLLKRTFEESNEHVCLALFSPDGKYLASRNGNVWSVSDGSLIRTFGSGWSLTFSPDGKHIAFGSKEGTVKIYHVSDGSLIKTLKYDSGSILAVLFSPDSKYLVSARSGGRITIWNIKSARAEQKIPE